MCVHRHKYRRLWYSVRGDDHVGVVAEVDLEWCRQQVSNRFIIKFRGNLEPHVEIIRSSTCFDDHMRRWPATRGPPVA